MEDPSIACCAVCLIEFDPLKCIPKFLSCHHSFCVICINVIATHGRLQCPLCRKISSISNLQTNNELLELARRIKEDDLKVANFRIQELTYGEKLLDVADKIKVKESEILKTEASLQAKVGGTSSQRADDNSKCLIKPDKTLKQSDDKSVGFPKAFKVIIDQQEQALNARNLIISNLRTRVSTLTQELLAAKQTNLELESKLSSKK